MPWIPLPAEYAPISQAFIGKITCPHAHRGADDDISPTALVAYDFNAPEVLPKVSVNISMQDAKEFPGTFVGALLYIAPHDSQTEPSLVAIYDINHGTGQVISPYTGVGYVYPKPGIGFDFKGPNKWILIAVLVFSTFMLFTGFGIFLVFAALIIAASKRKLSHFGLQVPIGDDRRTYQDVTSAALPYIEDWMRDYLKQGGTDSGQTPHV